MSELAKKRLDCTVLAVKQTRGENLNKNIFGSCLIHILLTKIINLNGFFSSMFASMLQQQLCLVQAVIFPGILNANENL